MQLELSNLSWKNICKDKDSCLHSVLKKSVPEKIDKLSDEDILNIKMSMFAYTMHIYSYVQMQKVCKSYGLVAKDTNTILHAILENFEVSIGLKQATLIMLSNSQMNIKSNIGKILKSNSLNESNAAFLKSVQGISLPKGILKKIKEKPLLPASQIRKNCNNDIKDLRPYVAKFVRRKLSFIVQHNRYDHEDLISDLTRKGVETYYRVTPFVTPEHRVNSMKQSIHNQGMKL
ncbi:MAG: hypothetical protein KGH75_04860, partial [Rhodospirillales bacterium]|nr:hypothetical protein [Rhodospirillales bacterium]